jgi:hypothetical protein
VWGGVGGGGGVEQGQCCGRARRARCCGGGAGPKPPPSPERSCSPVSGFASSLPPARASQEHYMLRALQPPPPPHTHAHTHALPTHTHTRHTPTRPPSALPARSTSGPNLRRLYLPGLDGLKAELRKLDFLLERFLPRLTAHLSVSAPPTSPPPAHALRLRS